jgi:hypothetical protein
MAGLGLGAVNAVGGPLGIVGRVVGLGQDEVAVGIPKWAWFGIGIVTGGIGCYLLHDRISKFVER